MTRRTKRLAIVAMVTTLPLFLVSGCLKEGDDTLVLPLPNGKIPYSVIPERLQDSLTTHGFIINEGLEPPSINGAFLSSPMDLHYASDDYVNNFFNLYMTFAGQHRRGMVRYNEDQDSIAYGTSIMANVIGKGDLFTMYCYQRLSQQDNAGDTLWYCKTATVVSGRLDSLGIHNCQYANIMLEKWGSTPDYDSALTATETYRIWFDGDSLAARVGN